MVQTDEDAAILAITSLASPDDQQIIAEDNIRRMLGKESWNCFADIHELFKLYDILYFGSLLSTKVELSWSMKSTLSAGICELVKDNRGRYQRIRLKLSEPLLKYRPFVDTINTLLHESIHAYFFITGTWRHTRGEGGTGGHGTGFCLMADAINDHGGYDITVFHTFHDEVDSYRSHVWSCNGPCQSKRPYFGLVKRSMNRAPSKHDPWWNKHAQNCGGTYQKISEPPTSKAKVAKMSQKERAGLQRNKISSWLTQKSPEKASNN